MLDTTRRWAEHLKGESGLMAESTLRHLLPLVVRCGRDFAAVPIDEVTTSMCARWVQQRTDPGSHGNYKHSYQKKRLSMLVGFFEWAIEHGHASDNPAAGIILGRNYQDDTDVDIFTSEECTSLLQHAGALRQLLAIKLGLYEAFRPIEMSRLLWGDVQGVTLAIRGKGAGGNISRKHPAHVSTLRTLERYRAWQEERFGLTYDELPVLHNSTNPERGITVQTVIHGITQVIRSAGIPAGIGKTPYSLRHTCLTTAAEESMLTAREMAGHQSDRHIYRYTKKANARLDRFQANRVDYG